MSAMHFSFARLVESALGRLDTVSEASLLRHLAGCSRCRFAHERASNLVAAVRSEHGVEPPARVLARAVKAVRAEALAAGRQPRTARAAGRRAALAARAAETLARLVLDSNVSLAAAGIRGGGNGVAAARQLLFESDGWDIDLSLERRGRRRSRARADAEGVFRFGAVPAGDVDVVVTLPGAGCVRLPRMAFFPD